MQRIFGNVDQHWPWTASCGDIESFGDGVGAAAVACEHALTARAERHAVARIARRLTAVEMLARMHLQCQARRRSGGRTCRGRDLRKQALRPEQPECLIEQFQMFVAAEKH